MLIVLFACEQAEDVVPADTADTAVEASDPFADRVVEFTPGELAGFGQDGMPDIVLGPPEGGGNIGSLDVVSLGDGGVIVLELDPPGLEDGPGVDLIVFENPFPGWTETGRVAVSEDGETWHAWPCDADGTGCAGLEPVWASSANDLDPTKPDEAGGDAFDLADLGLAQAFFVRITDTGDNAYTENTGGFDLDAVTAVGR